MDPSDFRGATLAEQQEDQKRVLATAAQLLSRAGQENERSGDKEDDRLKERDMNREGWDGSRKHRASKAEGPENGDKNARKSTEKKQKKKSSYVFYEDDHMPDDPIPEFMDDEYRTKKKGKKKYLAEHGKVAGDPGNLKGDGIVGGDGEVPREEPVTTKKKKKYKKSYPKKPYYPKPVLPANKDPAKSKLLDQAKTYNPNRSQRETNPFGVLLVRPPEVDFDLPAYLFDDPEAVKLETESRRSEDNLEDDDDEEEEEEEEEEDEDDEEGGEDEMEADRDGDREEEEQLSSQGELEVDTLPSKTDRPVAEEPYESSALSSLASEDEIDPMSNAKQEENNDVLMDTKEDFESSLRNE
jgi:hypothetical protein